MNKQTNPVLRLDKGATVISNDREYVIVAQADLNLLLVRERGSGEKALLKISDLSSRHLSSVEAKRSDDRSLDLLETDPQDWLIAEQRRDFIEPLLERQELASEVAARIVVETGVSRATLYRWVQAFRNTGLLSSLLPTKRSGGRGRGRLSKEVEGIIKDCIENYHLTDQKRSVAATAEEVRRLCSNAGLTLPHPLTVRKRIKWLTDRERVARREGPRVAEQRFDPNISSIPDADWPLAMVQVDHTLLPVMIVDEAYIWIMQESFEVTC